MLVVKKNANPLQTCIEFLPKLGNYLIGFTLLCYLSGFAIANLYLSSLGIVNLDILQIRYILVGLLFLLFLGAILYLVYGLIKSFRRDWWEPPLKIVSKAMWYSLQNISILLIFVIPSVAILAGSISTPIGIPGLSPTVPWSDWLTTAPKAILRRTTIVFAGLLIILAIILAILIAVNPKNKYGMREPRKKRLNEIGKAIPRFLGRLIVACVFTLLAIELIDLLTFLATNKVGVTSSQSSSLPSGWARFFSGIVVIYALVAVLWTFLFLSFRSSSKDKDDLQENPVASISLWVYLIAFAIAVIVPLYAYYIYPYLPQQIGGGQALHVGVVVSSDDLKSRFVLAQNEVYLIDRGPASALFLIINRDTQEHQVLEVSNSLIQSIIYNPSP
jgi:hypothetical protein